MRPIFESVSGHLKEATIDVRVNPLGKLRRRAACTVQDVQERTSHSSGYSTGLEDAKLWILVGEVVNVRKARLERPIAGDVFLVELAKQAIPRHNRQLRDGAQEDICKINAYNGQDTCLIAGIAVCMQELGSFVLGCRYPLCSLGSRTHPSVHGGSEDHPLPASYVMVCCDFIKRHERRGILRLVIRGSLELQASANFL